MIKLNHKIGIFACLGLLLSASAARAIITMDLGEAAGRISSVAGDVLRAGQKELDKVEQNVFGNLMGDGNSEAKAIIKQVDGWKTDYAKLKLKAGANADTYAGSKGLSSRLAKLEAKIRELVAQRTQIGQENSEQQKIKEDEINQKIKEIDANIAELQAQYATTDDMEIGLELENMLGEYGEQKEELLGQLKALQEGNLAANAAELKKITDALNALNVEKQKLAKLLEEELKKAIKSAINLDDPKDALQKAKDQNYVPDEVAEEVKELRIKRFIERRNAITSTYTESVQMKYRMFTEPDVFKNFEATAEQMETLVGQIGMDTLMKIKIIELLMQQAGMMVNDLREDTAIEYAALRFYKMRQPENALVEFNLDDYIFDCSAQ